MIERTLKTEPIKLPEILEVNRVAEIVQKIFESLPFEIGREFVQSNLILTMAGLKPTTEMYVMLNDHMTLERYARELQQLAPLLNSIDTIIDKPIGPLIHASEQKPIAMVEMVSLRGVERTAKLSRFKGMPDFKSTEGLEGYQRWLGKVRQLLREAQATGSIPKDYNIQYIYEGIGLGYPDQAIWDFTEALAKGDQSQLVYSHQEIPDMRRHRGLLPTYAYFEKHAQDPNIVQNITTTKQFLMEFYASPAYQKIMVDKRWKTT